MSRSTKLRIDCHTQAASMVAANTYFVVAEFSSNENPGLLVGTEVVKCKEPEAVESRYWHGLYWTVFVTCPNGEIRKVCCDVLKPRNTDKYFKRQQKIFPQVSA
jgi:hypothetical protein